MKNVYKNFYVNLYNSTNGYIPTKPLNSIIYPGDFFQIQNGNLVILGNIFRDTIINIEDAVITYHNKLNTAGWNINSGIGKPYAGRGNGTGNDGSFEYSRQVLSFAKRGSFIFHAAQPETARIVNWDEISEQLIIKMTQTHYSFRELYLVTETATAQHWSLAIAAAENAELEIASDAENYGLVDIFGHQSAKTVQARDIEFYWREPHRRPSFFKAKKLVVNSRKTEQFISDLITRNTKQQEWARTFYDLDIEGEISNNTIPNTAAISVLDMLAANELNPNTALDYFRWADATLDDINKMFPADVL